MFYLGTTWGGGLEVKRANEQNPTGVQVLMEKLYLTSFGRLSVEKAKLFESASCKRETEKRGTSANGDSASCARMAPM